MQELVCIVLLKHLQILVFGLFSYLIVGALKANERKVCCLTDDGTQYVTCHFLFNARSAEAHDIVDGIEWLFGGG